MDTKRQRSRQKNTNTRLRPNLQTQHEQIIMKTIIIIATLFSTIILASAETDLQLEEIYNYKHTEPVYSNPPAIKPPLPVHRDLPPSMPKIESILISKTNRQRFYLDFEITTKYTPTYSSNILVNVIIEKTHDIENLHTVNLHIGKLYTKSPHYITDNADLIVPIWQCLRFSKDSSQDNIVILNFSISSTLIKNSYLVLECRNFDSSSYITKISNRETYIIDLNTFVPEPPPPKKLNQPDNNDNLDINFG